MKTDGIDLHSLVTNGLYVKQYETWFNSRYSNFPIQIINNKSTTPEKRLGAIGDLMFAVERLGWWNENILILPSDTYYEFPLQRLVDFVQEKRDFVCFLIDLLYFQIPHSSKQISFIAFCTHPL